MNNESTNIKANTPKEGSEDPYELLIYLQNFTLRHDTYQEKTELDNGFIGRTKLRDQLTELLKNTSESRGSYLVAGYRGSGKTSLINLVLEKYKKRGKETILARINLGHDAVLDTRHVLFNIISVLKNELNEYYQKKSKIWLAALLFPFFLIIISWLLYTPTLNTEQTLSSNTEYNCEISISSNPTNIHCDSKNILTTIQNYSIAKNTDFLSFLLSFKAGNLNLGFTKTPLLIIFIFFLALFLISFKRIRAALIGYIFSIGGKKYTLIKNVQKLHDRVAYSFEKDLEVLGLRSAGIGFRHKTNIPEMQEPQIELELLRILEKCRAAGFDIIFIFDELDKISLTVTETTAIYNTSEDKSTDKLDDETINEHIYRRKKAVDSLLASLKTLITVGKARFFFIAGRDMLDSYQSEKGSTSSLYESLFNQVFEVPSFLTDDSDHKVTRLHSMIEVYVCSRLLNTETADKFWFANQICGKIISKLKNDIQNSLDNQLDSKKFRCILKSILNICNENKAEYITSVTRCYILKKQKDYIAELRNSAVRAEQYSCLAQFIRDILLACFNLDNLKAILSKIDNDFKNPPPYSSNRLNTYYHYLTYQDKLNQDVSKGDAKLIIYTLNQFISYLTIHSWGNCKRLASLFESFTKPSCMSDSGAIHNTMWLPGKENSQYMLHFGIIERQRISMGSNLYVVFNHHLSRQFTGADKLVVSTMAALHYCLKFHRSAFSRHHLFRMTEMMSIYSSPELNSIFETTLSQVLWPYLRSIHNGMLQYRYFTWIEQEIRYIARVNDLESASYTFSLDAVNNIKAHYRKTLTNATGTYKNIRKFSRERGPGLIAEINIVLGDIYLLERAYDEAVIFYQTAVNAHHSLNQEENYHLECLLRYVEALLKLGNVQEHRQRYDRAAVNYFQARQLVDDFLKQHDQPNIIETLAGRGTNNQIKDFISICDPKWVLLKQPIWAFYYLEIKKSQSNDIDIKPHSNLYKPTDPYGEYRKGQMFFYLGRHKEATVCFKEAIKLIGSNNPYYSAYLLPTTCVNLAENILLEKMQALTKKHQKDAPWETYQLILTEDCFEFINSMAEVSDIESLQKGREEIVTLCKENNLSSMKNVLTLIFYAAAEFKTHNLYDQAAMAYLKAISVWLTMIDISPHDKFKIRKFFKAINDSSWFDETIEAALSTIMDSNGQAQQQSIQKWFFRDLANFPGNYSASDIGAMGYQKIKKLQSFEDRKELNKEIVLWQGSYLGQMLVAMQNWAYTTKRILLRNDACPLKGHKLPLYTTRTLILSSWANGREHLGRAIKIIKTKNGASAKEVYMEFSSLSDNHDSDKECFVYNTSAKGIHDFYKALYYTRILTDNNQAIIIPPSAFIMLHLWRLLYNLVDYEKNSNSSQDAKTYEESRIAVRIKLMNYVSPDTPSSHLDLDYVEKEAVRQLQMLSNMSNLSSTPRINILQNKYYLDDDYEDPGFHLDWTVVQMLIPSALLSIKWIKKKMDILTK